MGEEGGYIFPILLISMLYENKCSVLRSGRSFSGTKVRAVESESEGILSGVGVGVGTFLATPTPTPI
jgi:hypothetical protein